MELRNYIFRANIDHYLELLYDHDLAVEKCAMVVKLLMEEEDQVSALAARLDNLGKAPAERRRARRR